MVCSSTSRPFFAQQKAVHSYTPSSHARFRYAVYMEVILDALKFKLMDPDPTLDQLAMRAKNNEVVQGSNTCTRVGGRGRA
jgi:hypothetical protein